MLADDDDHDNDDNDDDCDADDIPLKFEQQFSNSSIRWAGCTIGVQQSHSSKTWNTIACSGHNEHYDHIAHIMIIGFGAFGGFNDFVGLNDFDLFVYSSFWHLVF